MLSLSKNSNDEEIVEPFDFRIVYHFERKALPDDLFIFELIVKDNKAVPPLELFDQLITMLDVLFPEEFVSSIILNAGYISGRLPPIQYDKTKLVSGILSLGDYFYLSERMIDNTGISSNVFLKDKLIND